MRRLVLAGSALAALVLVPAVSSSDAQPGVRTVDRVFSCSLVPRGDGTFDLDLAVAPRSRYEYPGADPVILPAHVQVMSGANTLDGDLVAVRSGPRTGISRPRTGISRVQPAGAFVHSRKCRPARASLALSPRGLPNAGPPWGTGVECKAPRRVLVRVKATFTVDTPWRKVDANYTGGRSPVVHAQVALRAEGKSALMGLMTVTSDKRASIRYSGRCA